ncbi:MAG: hypothetical protein MZW92_31945 [Comamonadaceae bacterium]|nr:hypothetical protein [Comamonadaceae bacterium]
MIITLLATIGTTEAIKRWARATTTKNDDWTPPVLALFVGTAIGSATWPNDTEVEPVIFGFVIGISATLIYKIVIAVIRWKWPALADKLTGEGTKVSNLTGPVGELRATVTIKRKATGKVETYELVGRTTPEQHEQLMQDLTKEENDDGSHP